MPSGHVYVLTYQLMFKMKLVPCLVTCKAQVLCCAFNSNYVLEKRKNVGLS